MKKQIFSGLLIVLALLIIVGTIILINNQISPQVNLKLNLYPYKTINETELPKLTLIVESQQNMGNVKGEIILPEEFELVEGNLHWKIDLIKNKPEEISVTIKPTKEGKWDIQAFAEGHSAVELKTEINSSLQVKLSEKIDPSYSIEMIWEEWVAREEERMRDPVWIEKYYRACFDANGCRVPEPLKGQELNDYFKSLNLTDDPIYVMVQFDVSGADPSQNQVNTLESKGVKLLDLGGGVILILQRHPNHF